MPHWLRQRDPSDPEDAWSAPLGVWGGVPVGVHVSLAITAVIAIGWTIETASFELGLGIAVYLASLALHEAAHAFAALRVGGSTERVTLGPFGGLCPPRISAEPKARVFVAMAGPLAHLAVVVSAVCYLALRNDPTLSALLAPPTDGSAAGLTAVGGEPAVLLARLAVWINWPLFVLNLLPAFPFDGGAAMRALFSQWVGLTTATEMTRRIALAIGVVLAVGSTLMPTSAGLFPVPAALLAALGVLLVFGAHRDKLRARNGSTKRVWPDSLGRPIGEGFLDASPWLEEDEESMVLIELGQAATGAPPSQADPAWDDSRVDKILAKLHAKGIGQLTAEERTVLDRASEHYRKRNG